MKKLTFILAAVFTIGWSSCFTTDSNDPANKVLADTSHFTTLAWADSVVSFGTAKMGEKINVAFRFTNTGKYPLFLTAVRAGCGCTVPDYTKGAIPPGGQGVVTGAFDTNKAHEGEVRKSIFVTANTKGKISHTLVFTGTIEQAAK